MTERYWCGEAPSVCQICDRPILEVFVDGNTQWDCWAFMCRECWEMHGEGLGTGRGQMYGRQIDGRWKKLQSVGYEPQRETRSWQAIEAAEFARLADQLRAGNPIVDIWDYPVTHDGDLDNPVQ